MKTIFKCALLTTTTILLSACGGGGGGTSTKVVSPTKPIVIQSDLYKVDGQEAFLMVSQKDKTKPAIFSYKDFSSDTVKTRKLVSFGILSDDKDKEITDQSLILAIAYFKMPNTQNEDKRVPVQIKITGTSPLSLEWDGHDFGADTIGNMSRSTLQDFPVTSVVGTWEDNNKDVRMTIDDSNVEVSTSACNVTGVLVKDASTSFLEVSTTYSIDNISVTPSDCNIDGLVMMSNELNWFVTLNHSNDTSELHKLIKTSN